MRKKEFFIKELDWCNNISELDAALNDCMGCGRKREISDLDITWIIDKACEHPEKCQTMTV